MQQIIDDSVLQKYEEAQHLCREIEEKYPNNPAGYFFRAAVLQSKMMDYENYDDLDKFFRLTKRAIRLSRKDIRKNSRNSWPYFFLGASLAYKAFYHFREKDFLQAFRDGWNSIKTLELALERDPSNYDIYLGIGAFKYYRSKYSRYLKALPFVKDERELGIQMIRQTIEHGKFAYSAALNALIWIYIEEGRYAEAEQLVYQALSKYPGSRFFLWGKAAVEYKQKKWAIAAAAYQKILASYQKPNDGGSDYNEMVCYTMLADIYQKTHQYEKASLFAQKALQIKLEKPLQKKAKVYWEKAEQILESNQEVGGAP